MQIASERPYKASPTLNPVVMALSFCLRVETVIQAVISQTVREDHRVVTALLSLEWMGRDVVLCPVLD